MTSAPTRPTLREKEQSMGHVSATVPRTHERTHNGHGPARDRWRVT